MFKQMGFAALILSAALPAIAADTSAEIVFWQSINQESAADYRAYLKQYPHGQFSELAKSRLAGLGGKTAAASVEPKAASAPKATAAKASGGKASKAAAARDGQPNPSGEAEPVPDPNDANWVKVGSRDCFVRSPTSAVPEIGAKASGWKSDYTVTNVNWTGACYSHVASGPGDLSFTITYKATHVSSGDLYQTTIVHEGVATGTLTATLKHGAADGAGTDHAQFRETQTTENVFTRAPQNNNTRRTSSSGQTDYQGRFSESLHSGDGQLIRVSVEENAPTEGDNCNDVCRTGSRATEKGTFEAGTLVEGSRVYDTARQYTSKTFPNGFTLHYVSSGHFQNGFLFGQGKVETSSTSLTTPSGVQSCISEGEWKGSRQQEGTSKCTDLTTATYHNGVKVSGGELDAAASRRLDAELGINNSRPSFGEIMGAIAGGVAQGVRQQQAIQAQTQQAQQQRLAQQQQAQAAQQARQAAAARTASPVTSAPNSNKRFAVATDSNPIQDPSLSSVDHNTFAYNDVTHCVVNQPVNNMGGIYMYNRLGNSCSQDIFVSYCYVGAGHRNFECASEGYGAVGPLRPGQFEGTSAGGTLREGATIRYAACPASYTFYQRHFDGSQISYRCRK